MKRISLPLALFAALSLAGILWLLAREPDSKREVEALAPSGPSAVAPAGIAQAGPSLEAQGPRGASLEAAESAAAERSAADLDARALAEASWIEGSVVAPRACALEEPLEVVALSSAFEGLALSRALGESGRGARVAIESAFDEGSDGERAEDGASSSAKLRAVKVAADGSFRLPRLAEEETLHLAVRGRTLWSEATVAVAAEREEPVRLEPSCGAALLGRLVPPAGLSASEARSLEGVEIRLETAFEGLRGAPQTMRTARRNALSDAEGRFVLAALPADMPFELTLSGERWAWRRLAVAKLAPGEQRELEVPLELGGRVAGRVLDEEGAPLSGATVRASKAGRWFGFDDPEVRRSVTGADGRFTLEAVATGKVGVKASAPGRLDSEPVEVELAPAGLREGLELVVGRGAAIAGRVRWPDGSPAALVEVKVGFDMTALGGMGAFNMRRGASGRTRSDEEGRFRVTGLGAGPFTVTAEARPGADSDAEAQTPLHRARVDTVQPNTLELALELAAPLSLAGRVQTPDKQPVTRFRLELQALGEGMFAAVGREKRSQGFEDEEGRFLVEELAGGRWKLFALAEGHAVPEGVEVVLPLAASEELVLFLEPECVVEGTVLDPRGKPAPGATVRLHDDTPRWQRDLAGGVPPPQTSALEEGRFRLAGLRAGSAAFVAEHADWCASEPVARELRAGEVQQGLVLVLREGATLSGEVLLGGKPAPGVFLQTTHLADFDQRMASTEADGGFRFERLRPGSWQIVAMPGLGGSSDAAASGEDALAGMGEMLKDMKYRVVELVDGEATHVTLGDESGSPVKVHGRVTHDGRPYARAMITFFPAGKDSAQGARYGTLSEDGRYSLELSRPGSYAISVQRLGATGAQQQVVEFSRVVPEAEEVELDFEIPTGRISGRVLGPDGGPLGGVRISLHPGGALEAGTMFGGQYVEALSEGGRFDIEGLRPGRYELLAGGMSVMNMGGAARYGRVARTLELTEGQWIEDADLRLPEASTLVVRARDASGKPVPQATLFVRDAAGRLLDRLSFTATDSAGRARYEGLAPGDYTVCARTGALASDESPRVRVGEGDTTELELRLEGGTLLYVSLVGDEEEALEARFSITDEHGRELGGMLSLPELMETFGKGFSKTEQRVGPLPPGRYVASAILADGRSVKKPVTLTGQGERKLVLRLK